MKRDYIEINKKILPYKYNIILGGELFEITVYYNERNDIFTLRLKKDNELICIEPIVYGVPLFKDTFVAGKYPVLTIIPSDDSGDETTLTFANANETVFLVVENAGDENE